MSKILIISDHALSPSGVGVQTKFLVEGLLKKNDYEFNSTIWTSKICFFEDK